MDKKKYLYLIIIILAALGIRLYNLDKPQGLWNDEYLSWFISAKDFGPAFFEGIKNNCHMPLYYFYLKGWMLMFGQSDYVLRLSSVFSGMLCVITMFFLGREYKDEKTGLICALFGALSSFLIYYSQEVRFYSLLFFFSAGALLFGLRTIKDQTRLNYTFFSIFNFLVLITHTIGLPFVVFNIAALGFCIKKKGKKSLIPLLITSICVLILFLPLVPFILDITGNRGYISQWWGVFSWAKIGYMFSDYFSPVLTNLVNSPLSFFAEIYNGKTINFGLIIFAIIPSLICLYGVVASLIKPKKTELYLFSICLATTLTLVIAAISGKMVFTTKYSIEIYPALILLAMGGLMGLKSKTFKTILLTIFFVLSSFFIIAGETSSVKLVRKEGNKIVAEGIQSLGLKKNDYLLFLYYPPTRFEKYISFKGYNNINSIDKYNYYYYLLPSSEFDNYKENLYTAFTGHEKNEYLENYLNYDVLPKLKKNSKLAVILLSEVSLIEPDQFNYLKQNKKTLSSVPLMYLTFSYLKNSILNWGVENLTPLSLYKNGSWEIYVFQKK